MCREILIFQPYNFKPRSVERGKAWDEMAQQLNAMDQPIFRVTSRSVRDRYTLLSTKMSQKLRDEQRASGIDVPDQTELDILLEDILEREREAKLKLDVQDLEKKNNAAKEKSAAEEVRKQALDRMGKRKSDDGTTEKEIKTKTKVRRSTADVIEYLTKKTEMEKDYKKEELEIRKREIELAAEKQDQTNQQQQNMLTAMMSQMQQQQQQQQAMQAMLISQQQQQAKMLMSLMEKRL